MTKYNHFLLFNSTFHHTTFSFHQLFVHPFSFSFLFEVLLIIPVYLFPAQCFPSTHLTISSFRCFQGVYQFQPQIESFATDSPSFNKSEPFSGQLSENHQSCFEPLVPLGGSPLFPLSVTSWSASSQSSHSSLAEQNGSAECNGMQAVCNAAPSIKNEALSLWTVSHTLHYWV